MSIAQFSLVRKVPVTILRRSQDVYDDNTGKVVKGIEEQVIIQANVHPFSDYQVSILPESDRTRSWLWVFTSDLIRSKKEGGTGVAHGGDRFYWEGDLYEVMKTQRFSMSISDHYEGKAAKVNSTPN